MHLCSYHSATGLFLAWLMVPAFAADARAAADHWAGKYDGDKVQIEIVAGTDGVYTGTIRMGEKQFPLRARIKSGKLDGTFKSDANEFTFTASLAGGELKLLTGDTALSLKRQSPPKNPLAEAAKKPANPLAEAAKSPPNPLAAAAGETQEYRHIDRRFIVRYPNDWRLIRDIEQSVVRYCFTPETTKEIAKDVDINLSIYLSVVDESLPFVDQDPITVLKHMLPMYRTAEPGIEPQGEVTVAKLGKLDAARVSFKGKLKRKETVFAGDLYLAQADGIFYEVVTAAPETEYSARKAGMQQILDQSDFGYVPISTRGLEQPASEIVERFKESVVSIESDLGEGRVGWGTGFIIHKNGYVASNAHVAVDLQNNMKPAQKYIAHWDQGLAKKTLPLTLVGYLFQPHPLNRHGDKDVALFKLPPGEYAAASLTPLSDVQLGDPIITLGFPHGGITFATLNIFTTRGVVTRFNRSVENKVDTLYIDAKITHGSSGGPCFSQITGGVIGLNSFGQDIGTNSRDNDLVGYNGVCPIEVLMERFPVVAELGLDPDSDPLDFYDSYALSCLYGNRRPVAAIEMAKRAVQLQPRSADAHCLLGQCTLRAARSKDDIDAALAAFNQSLDVQDDYQWALLMLSNLYLATGDMVKATQHADRAVKAHSDSFWVHYTQAQIYGSLKRYDEAIASANRAKELAHEVSAMPYILAGQLLYAQEKLDEGKQEYVEAGKIHPTNPDARLGIGKYYELKKDAQSALVEYGRVAVDLPDNPSVMTCMARCYNDLKQYDDALKTYSEVLTRCRLTGRTPQLEVFLTMGQICSDVKQKPDLALDVYVKGLAYYGTSPSGSDLHLKMAAIFRERKILGITYSHVSRALTLNFENEECKKQLAARDLPRLSFDDIVFLIQKQQYPDGIVADMILHTPLNFQKSADELNKLVKEGLPLSVGQAIFDSNKKYPPQQEGPAVADATDNQNPGNETPAENPDAGQNEMPAEENENQQGNEFEAPNAGGTRPAAFIGTWVAQLQTMNGDMTMTVQFAKNGQYSIRSELANGQSQSDQGVWAVQGQQLVFRSQNGRVEVDQWRMAGRGVLEVDVQNAGTITLNKQR